MLEWCSISLISTSSPASRKARPKACATRLIDSVVLRVKMISDTSDAPKKARTRSRAAS